MRPKLHLKKLYTELKSKPCMDCGRTFDPVCMDFDHRPGEKKLGSPQAFLKNEKKFLAEIAKCDLVCACCHRLRTKERGQSAEAIAKRSMTFAEPEVREAWRRSIKKALSRPETRRRISEAVKASATDPAVQEKRSAARRAWWARRRAAGIEGRPEVPRPIERR